MDESNSISNSPSIEGTIETAVTDFIQSLQNDCIPANIAIVEYGTKARSASIGGNTGFQTINAAYISNLNSYLNGGGNNSSNTSYNPGPSSSLQGSTNWEAALQLANTKTTGSCANPLIVLFTDGNPTTSSLCNLNGNSAGQVQCNGNHIGKACSAANVIKNNGKKIFTIAVPKPTVDVANIEAIASGSNSLQYPNDTSNILEADYLITTSGNLGNAFDALALSLTTPIITTTAMDADLGCNPDIVVPEFQVNHQCRGNVQPVVTENEVVDGCRITKTWTATFSDTHCNVDAVPVSIEYTYAEAEQPEAGVGENAVYCSADSGLSAVDLDSLVSNGDSGGVWTDVGNNIVASPIDLSTFSANSYTFTYTAATDDCDGCDLSDSTTVTITINDNPTVVAEDASVCLGESIQLEATPANGTWSGTGVSSGGLFDSSVQGAGSFEVTYTVTDGNSCDGSDSATVTVNVLPEPVAEDASVCLGATVQLEASPEGGTWSGTGVSSTGLFDTTGLSDDTYEVTYTTTDDNSCVGETTAMVTINPLPIAEIGGVLEICSGNSTALTASGGTSYLWSTGATTAAIEVATAGDYTVTVTDENGCTAEKTVTVIVNDNPSVVAEDTSVCLGESIQLEATPANGTWSGTGVSSGGLFDSSVQGAGSFEVTYTVTDGNSCDGSDSATVTVNVLPEPVAEDASVCLGATVQLEASPEGGTWSGTGVSSTGLFDTTGLSDDTYEVTYTTTDDNSCVGETTAMVTINPLPIAEIGGVLEICSGSSTTLKADYESSNVYVWNTGATTSGITVDTAGDYTVTVTNTYGCTAEATVTVIVNDSPTVEAEDASVCLGESIQLEATPEGGTWSGTGVSSDGLFDSSVQGAGSFEVTYTVTDGNSCDGSDSATVTVNVLPEPVAEDASVCLGATVQLEASPEGGTWSGTGVSSTGLFDTTGLSDDTYEVTYTTTDDNSCVGETTATVTINPLPIAEIGGVLEICSGNSTVLTASGGTSYLWSTGATTAAIEVAAAGDYTVTVTDLNGCTAEEMVTVIVNEKNDPLFGEIEPICEGAELAELPTISLNGISGSWSPALNNTVTTEYTFTPNDNECTNTAKLTIQVIEKPMPLITEVSICMDGEYFWEVNETTYSGLDGSVVITIKGDICEADQILRLMVPEIITCNITQDELTTDHITKDGVATVHPNGGSGNYTYLWDNGETTQTATTLTYGLHTVVVTDSNGCVSSCQIDIAKELYCWVNLKQNVSVYGGNDGEALVRGNGGYRPFTFKWDDGTTNALNTGLTAGTHYVTITDAKGATSQCSVTITEPTGATCDNFTVDIEQIELTTDHLTKDGVATVFPKAGTAPYTYLWDNGETTQTANKLTYGLRNVVVTDANGCETRGQIDIAKELYCWINLYANVSVYNGNDGAAKVYGNGGFRPHTFKWDDGVTEQMNDNLSAGTHYVTITDSKGATSRCSITISEPNEILEVCDGIDNDGDGKIDEGFDQDGDGVADCFDTCDQGDDHVDVDNDGIPDACDDSICLKGDQPEVYCYQTAVWNETTCQWDILDEQPEKPETQCFETAEWNDQSCSWEIIGEKPMEPKTECYYKAVWNDATCQWDILDGQPEKPVTQCFETAEWNNESCSWEIMGEKPMEPETECYQKAVWNETTCQWDVIDEQPEMPMTLCFETAVWNTQSCSWEIMGEKPMEPETACHETVVWNSESCEWDIEGEQPEMPETECYETAVWNVESCEWDIEGEQPEIPVTECNETAVWNSVSCEWDITENDNDCGSGTIGQCETAYARSSSENVRTCFTQISNLSGGNWGWTNKIPSINGTYELDLYAAAGQCDISKGALVGNVNIVYNNGSVNVMVSAQDGYMIAEAQLYVGSSETPVKGNGDLTVAPGQYPYQDNINGDFSTYTFQGLSAGDMDNFYVILHANVCPQETDTLKTAPTKIELTTYPIPFKEELNIELMATYSSKLTIELFDLNGRLIKQEKNHVLKVGDNNYKLSIGSLESDMYIIILKTDKEKLVKKVISKK
ncbi:T9SS type A sorting domain-containing protein [Maribacter ulvicola]|uniref:T9SS type A sorting domain-containing protein n=1 Tax=Maribacter ulvicola TaxID=228959 RepID=UPI0013565732|nr:T9SS type A sorting domain-containing protein [Maribacter ulvicola]